MNIQNLKSRLSSTTLLAAILAPIALSASPTPLLAQQIIDNGTIQLGINDFGNLIVPVDQIGLTYLPAPPGEQEALAPGCDCEGWGVADLGVGLGFGRSEGNGSSGAGAATLTVSGAGSNGLSSGSSAVSTVETDASTGLSLRAVHEFSSSASNNLYQVDVTLTNIGGLPITNLVYRRAMDWDVPPTAFTEFVTLQGWPAAALFGSSDNGFVDPNPNSGALGTISDAPANGNFITNGPDDHGAAFDFGFGTIAPGEDVTFTIYYGAAANREAAMAALAEVGAEVYSLGYSTALDSDGEPIANIDGITFIFAFSGVGGIPVGPGIIVDPVALVATRDMSLAIGQKFSEQMGFRLTARLWGANGDGEQGSALLSSYDAAKPAINVIDRTFNADPVTTEFTVGALAGFLTIEGSTASSSYGAPFTDYDRDTFTGTAGLDYDLGNGAFLGAAGSYTSASADADNGDAADLEAFSVGVYGGTRIGDKFSLDGTLSYSWGDVDTARVTGGGTAAGGTDVGNFTATVTGGMLLQFASFEVAPRATLGYSNISVDGFTETGPGAVAWADKSYDVFWATPRVDVRLPIELEGGRLLPTVGVGARLQDGSGEDTIAYSVAGVNREVATPGFDGAALIAAAGLGFVNNAGNFSASIDYQGEFGGDMESHTGALRLKLAF